MKRNQKLMSPRLLNERIHEELLVRLATHAEEMRTLKRQQWQTIYYTVLLLAAGVVAFQQQIPLGGLYTPVKWIAFALSILVCGFAILHLLALKYDMDLNRKAAESMESELDYLTGLSSRLRSLHKPRYDEVIRAAPKLTRWIPKVLTVKAKQHRLYNVMFYSLFIGIIVVAGISACLMIYFDQ